MELALYGAPGGEGWFLSYHCYDRYVKIAFFRGALLEPVPPEPSKSGDTRYLHIHEGEDWDEAQFADCGAGQPPAPRGDVAHPGVSRRKRLPAGEIPRMGRPSSRTPPGIRVAQGAGALR